MLRLLLLLAALTACAPASAAQTVPFEGRVTIAETGDPLVGATVLLDGTIYGATTGTDGRYRFSAPAGRYALVASFIGYEAQRRDVTARAGEAVAEDFALADAVTDVGQVVVTGASRRPERITDSPATVQVLSGADLQDYPGVSYEQALSRLKGVDYVRSGVTGFGINARGFNSAFNTKMLLLTDNRRQVLPGAGLPFANMNPVIKEDVERVEVILGPSSALYGPNAHNGTVNVITRDPRNSQGLTLVTEGGVGGSESEVYSARGRYAQAFADNRVALKVAGEYTAGQDFAFVDTVFASVAAPTPEAPGFDVNHLRGVAEVYATPLANTDVIVGYSGSQNSYLGVTNLGRNQVEDWTLHQGQLRVVHPRVFAQAYRTWSNSGETYALQNFAIFRGLGQDSTTAAQSAVFVDKSTRTNAEVQGNADFYGFKLIAGAGYELETAVSEGTYLSDTTGVGIDFEQFGLSAQVERAVVPGLRVVAAGRYDWQTNYGERFSPKLGLVYSPSPGNSFRVTYGEAFVAPTVLQQEIFIPSGAVGTTPIVIRGNAQGFTTLEGDGSVGAVAPLRPEAVRTVEAGFRGLPLPKLYVDVNAYYSQSDDFISPLVTVNGLVTAIGDRELAAPEVVLTYQNFGEVTSLGADLAATYMVSETVSVSAAYSTFSADLDDASFDLNDDGEVSPNEISLNTPGHKGSLTFTGRNLGVDGLSLVATVRGVSEYTFVSGRHFASSEQQGQRVVLQTAGGAVPFNYNYGPLGGFVTADLGLGYALTEQLALGLSVTNLFNVEQREFVAAAPTPRFATLSLRANLPAFGN
ncbi:MAG: TonB-dependent receptor [Bacteroidota bacterium]